MSMKTSRIPAIILGLLLIGYVAFLVSTVSLLPPHIATHFDGRGQPTGWMTRSSAAAFQGVIGLLLPLIVAASFCIVRFIPTRAINFPNRDFWFSAERRNETCTYLSRQGLWLASLLVLVQAMVWYQLIESNLRKIPHLSLPAFLITVGAFGTVSIVWVIKLFNHFRKGAS